MTDERDMIVQVAAQSAYDEWYERANRQAYVRHAILAGAERAAYTLEARVRAEVAGERAGLRELLDLATAKLQAVADLAPKLHFGQMGICGPDCPGCRLARTLAGIAAGSSPDTTPEPKGDEQCQRCHGPNPPWSAPSPLWNAVMRGGSIDGEEPGGIVCATCFTVLAEERIGAELWRLSAERVPVELETATPSGRVWDAETWLWRHPMEMTFKPRIDDCGMCDLVPTVTGYVRGTQVSCPVHGTPEAS